MSEKPGVFQVDLGICCKGLLSLPTLTGLWAPSAEGSTGDIITDSHCPISCVLVGTSTRSPWPPLPLLGYKPQDDYRPVRSYSTTYDEWFGETPELRGAALWSMIGVVVIFISVGVGWGFWLAGAADRHETFNIGIVVLSNPITVTLTFLGILSFLTKSNTIAHVVCIKQVDPDRDLYERIGVGDMTMWAWWRARPKRKRIVLI